MLGYYQKWSHLSAALYGHLQCQRGSEKDGGRETTQKYMYINNSVPETTTTMERVLRLVSYVSGRSEGKRRWASWAGRGSRVGNYVCPVRTPRHKIVQIMNLKRVSAAFPKQCESVCDICTPKLFLRSTFIHNTNT